jgi:hypothetical protein
MALRSTSLIGMPVHLEIPTIFCFFLNFINAKIKDKFKAFFLNNYSLFGTWPIIQNWHN